MLVGIMMGQRTPGVTIAQAREFEERINQTYVDHLVGAGWGYYGVYQVDGLVPGAFGEILTFEGDSVDEALRRDKENDANLTEHIRAFYAECRSMFWQRGSSGQLWRVYSEPPPRNSAIRVTFVEGTFELEPTDVAPEEAVDVVREDDPRMPDAIEPGTSVVFQPFVMAPLPGS